MSGCGETWTPGDVVTAAVTGPGRSRSRRRLMRATSSWWGPGVGFVPTSDLSDIRRCEVTEVQPTEPMVGGVVRDSAGCAWVRVPTGGRGFAHRLNWVSGTLRCKWEHIEVVEIIDDGTDRAGI